MKRSTIAIVSVIASLLLGLLTYWVFASPGEPQPDQATPQVANLPTNEAGESSTDESQLAIADTLPDSPAPTPRPVIDPISPGNEAGDDVADVLFFFDPDNQWGAFDTNFCLMVEFYGLGCEQVNLREEAVTGDLLTDANGNPYKLVGIRGPALGLLDDGELSTLLNATVSQGINVLVYETNPDTNPNALQFLTSGAVGGVIDPDDTSEEWVVSDSDPAFTRELSGMTFAGTSSKQRDFGLVWGDSQRGDTIIYSFDDEGSEYPIFVRTQQGAGNVFVSSGDAGTNLLETPLRELYYIRSQFIVLTPMMMTLRYVMGDEVWHNDQNYANLTLDDPALTSNFGTLDYYALLQEMEAHNFHTTIAFVPENYPATELNIAQLFIENPGRYSLVQHGNSGGEGYEFYLYQVPPGSELPAKPLDGQIADINEGLRRMEEHERLTGIPYDRIMIFPWGISPERTFQVLKRYNYLATINGQDVPLDSVRPTYYSYGMYQANLDYASFASLWRRFIIGSSDIADIERLAALDLFVDKPILLYSHAYEGELFTTGPAEFNPFADVVNALEGDIEWQSLGHIIRRLHLRKINDDGSVTIKMYGNNLIFTNDSTEELTFHVTRVETLNVPISEVTVNGQDFPYRIEDYQLILDLAVPAGKDVDILIQYGS